VLRHREPDVSGPASDDVFGGVHQFYSHCENAQDSKHNFGDNRDFPPLQSHPETGHCPALVQEVDAGPLVPAARIYRQSHGRSQSKSWGLFG
jgi:hypothetical protein